MVFRAILLTALAAFLFNGIVRADDDPKLPGSTIKIEDAVAKSDVVFTGLFTSLGVRADEFNIGAGLASYGALITVGQQWKGKIYLQISASIFPNSAEHEITPKVGDPYFFFVARTDSASGNKDPFTVLKLLPDTKDNEKTVIFAILHARAKAKLLEIEKEKSGN